MRPVLRPEVPSWKKPKHRSWAMDDLEDPEQIAREAIAELQGAIDILSTMLELLTSSKPRNEDR
jgi:hypothetical protein